MITTSTSQQATPKLLLRAESLEKPAGPGKMTGLPSHLFVIRHGNRLDAADKRWHLSSPTPYDPPLTYGGWLQARQTGAQIANYLENAKVEAELSRGNSNSDRKRRRFKVVIHSSPFLRCIQTSIAISSGLAQASPESSLQPSDLLAPVPTPTGKIDNDFRSSILRLDSFLGEWLSPEYFENITPPPSSSLMLGTAKADLLKREDYSIYTDFSSPAQPAARKNSLWSASSDRPRSPAWGDTGSSASSTHDDRKGYGAPRPTYAVSSAGKIPDGFVAHARDQCLAVDYQWDSMRQPLDFGDGGKLGEEWTTMHHRFRGGLKRMLNWYATADSPERPVSSSSNQGASEGTSPANSEEVEEETVVIIVSHGAGCNALIGAITHQPVLMDVGIASITMAVRKPELDFAQLRNVAQSRAIDPELLVPVDQLYDIRLSASTDHLRSTGSTPVSSRSSSAANVWTSTNSGSRGRTSTLGSLVGPSLASFQYSEPMSPGSRSSSAHAAVTVASTRPESSSSTGPTTAAPRPTALSSTGIFSSPGSGNGATGGTPVPPPATGQASFGLWTPTPSNLRLMDDGGDDSAPDDYGFPDFDQTRLKAPVPRNPDMASSLPIESFMPNLKKPSNGPTLAAPIRLNTNWSSLDKPKTPEEISVPRSGEGISGLWGQPIPPSDAEKNRDMSHTKRRWTVNEQNRP